MYPGNQQVYHPIPTMFPGYPQYPVQPPGQYPSYPPNNGPVQVLNNNPWSPQPPNPPASDSSIQSTWRSKFPKLPTLILGIVQIVFTGVVFILEIASLAILASVRPTGVGIWCSLFFFIASILTIVLVRRMGASRPWATGVLIAQLILVIFTTVLIGITGDFIANMAYYLTFLTGSSSTSAFQTKVHITQAQLAFGVLLMVSGLIYVALYIYVTVVAIWQPSRSPDCAHLFRE